MSDQLKARLLIVDDDQEKVAAVAELWEQAQGPTWSELLVASSIRDANKLVETVSFDLMILDLCIPRRSGGTPDESEAKRFMEDLHEGDGMRPPREVVVLSSFESILAAETGFYQMKGWMALQFGTELKDWRTRLLARFEYIKKCVEVQSNEGRASFESDYCVISALRQPELKHFLSMPFSWKSTGQLDATEFYKGSCTTDVGEKSIVCGSSFGMGMVHSSLLTFKAWHYFRPRFVIMIGITAGVKSATNFGDILIAEEVWDYGAGKIAADKQAQTVFTPDPRHVSAEHSLTEALWSFGQDQSITRNIEDSWPAKRPETNLSVKKGPIASGAAVVSNELVVKNIIQGNRKLIGLEMEAFGVYSACEYLPRPRPRYICVKSVCDFADGEKNDDFQDYAAYTSAEFVRRAIVAGVLERV